MWALYTFRALSNIIYLYTYSRQNASTCATFMELCICYYATYLNKEQLFPNSMEK